MPAAPFMASVEDDLNADVKLLSFIALWQRERGVGPKPKECSASIAPLGCGTQAFGGLDEGR